MHHFTELQGRLCEVHATSRPTWNSGKRSSTEQFEDLAALLDCAAMDLRPGRPMDLRSAEQSVAT